jgi:predicted alpha/beta-hydrolase family hydrolase
MTVNLLIDGPADAGVTLALAHGAGAPMDSPFMDFMATALAGHGIRVARFEFPYMAERRSTGKKRPPDRQPVLLDCWRAVIATLREGGAAKLAIGGKSMGGRMASLIANEAQADGLVCLGYPFHPPGKPDRPRTEHLAGLRTPALIVQGERDPMGNRDDVAGHALSKAIRVLWAPDGNHDLAPRKASGRTKDRNWQDAADAVADFLRGL